MTLIRPGTRRARGEDVMCCRDRGVAALVTRGDEEAALLGWCYTLVLLLARGIKGECVCLFCVCVCECVLTERVTKTSRSRPCVVTEADTDLMR